MRSDPADRARPPRGKSRPDTLQRGPWGSAPISSIDARDPSVTAHSRDMRLFDQVKFNYRRVLVAAYRDLLVLKIVIEWLPL